MAVTFVASTAGTTTATLPAGTTSGDIVVVFAHSASATTPTLPASWNNIVNGSTNPAMRVQYRVYDGVWTMPTFTNANQCHALTLRGQDTVSPIGVTSITSVNSTNVTWPTVTLQDASGNGQLLRSVNHTRPDSVITAPTGHTSRQASGTQPGWMTCTKNSTTDGLTATSTVSRGTTWTQAQVEIRQPFVPTQNAAVAMTATSTMAVSGTIDKPQPARNIHGNNYATSRSFNW